MTTPSKKNMMFNIRKKKCGSWNKLKKRMEYGIAKTHTEQWDTLPNLVVIIHDVQTNEVLYRRWSELKPTARLFAGDTLDKGGTLFIPKCELNRWSVEPLNNGISITRENALS